MTGKALGPTSAHFALANVTPSCHKLSLPPHGVSPPLHARDLTAVSYLILSYLILPLPPSPIGGRGGTTSPLLPLHLVFHPEGKRGGRHNEPPSRGLGDYTRRGEDAALSGHAIAPNPTGGGCGVNGGPHRPAGSPVRSGPNSLGP